MYSKKNLVKCVIIGVILFAFLYDVRLLEDRLTKEFSPVFLHYSILEQVSTNIFEFQKGQEFDKVSEKSSVKKYENTAILSNFVNIQMKNFKESSNVAKSVREGIKKNSEITLISSGHGVVGKMNYSYVLEKLNKTTTHSKTVYDLPVFKKIL